MINIQQIVSSVNQTMHIYLKNNPAKFQPDPILNDGSLGFFFEQCGPKKNNNNNNNNNSNNKMSRDVGSIKYVCRLAQELTSNAHGGLAGSRRTMPHMQQLAAGGREMTS